jgi:hypothetical protein
MFVKASQRRVEYVAPMVNATRHAMAFKIFVFHCNYLVIASLYLYFKFPYTPDNLDNEFTNKTNTNKLPGY